MKRKKDWRAIMGQIRLMFGDTRTMLSRREVEALLGVERHTVYRLTDKGMPTIRVSERKTVYPVEELARWLAER